MGQLIIERLSSFGGKYSTATIEGWSIGKNPLYRGVLYQRCPLFRVSFVRGSTVYFGQLLHALTCIHHTFSTIEGWCIRCPNVSVNSRGSTVSHRQSGKHHLCITNVPGIITDGAPCIVVENLHSTLRLVVPAHQSQVGDRFREDEGWWREREVHLWGNDDVIMTSYLSILLQHLRSDGSCADRAQNWSIPREWFPCQRKPHRPTRFDLRVM